MNGSRGCRGFDVGEIIVQATGLMKQYGPLVAVAGIDFHVFTGECFGLLGPNGAGKTSTFRVVCCVSPISGGRLLVAGKDVTREPRVIKHLLGVAPQEDNLDSDLSVLQNLLVYARYFDMPGPLARQRAEEALRLFQLQDRHDARVDTLSGGMKRRLLIARALLNAPKLLVLDEPTTGLDPQARHLIWQQLRGLKSQGVTILLSTHYMEEAARLCDRLAIMHEGHILAEGPPTELVRQFAGAEVLEVPLEGMASERALAALDGGEGVHQQVGDRLYFFGDDVPKIKARLEGLGFFMVQRPPTLEDVFLLMTGTALRD